MLYCASAELYLTADAVRYVFCRVIIRFLLTLRAVAANY
jgi:hypothetical protein